MLLCLLVVRGEAEVLFGLFMCSFFFMFALGWENRVEVGGLISLDLVRVVMLVLSFYISSLMFLRSVGVKRFNAFKSMILLICAILVMAFSFSSIFLFYICFERVLVPTLLLILGWGYQPERVQAINYILVYTVAGSIPLIYGLRSLY